MVTIKFSNRALYTFITAVIIIALAGVAFAFTNSQGVGHDADELSDTGICKPGTTECGTGVQIYQFPEGEDAIHEGTFYTYICESDCNNRIVLSNESMSIPQCTSYPGEVRVDYDDPCRTSEDPCGFYFGAYYCATPTTVNATLIVDEIFGKLA